LITELQWQPDVCFLLEFCMMLTISVCCLHGIFPEIVADIVLYDDDDDTDSTHLHGQTDPAGWAKSSTGHIPAADDAEDAGKILAEANKPGLIRTGMHGSTRPPTTDRVPAAPASGARGWKCPCIAMKQSDQGHCAANVITQPELPPLS
jgi:hypothetical protein